MPVLGSLTSLSYGYLKRLPGADVALGVAAYQIAASTQAAVASVGKSRVLAREVAQVVGDVLDDAVDEMGGLTGQGLELARHAARCRRATTSRTRWGGPPAAPSWEHCER